MYTSKTNPRAEYRRYQIEQANNSATLAAKFPNLKALTADLAYFDTDGLTKTGELRYTVNVQHARSLFSFMCPSDDCIGGDFNLSEAIAKAVGEHRENAEGEIRCEGSRRKMKGHTEPCQNMMRYKLCLGYV